MEKNGFFEIQSLKPLPEKVVPLCSSVTLVGEKQSGTHRMDKEAPALPACPQSTGATDAYLFSICISTFLFCSSLHPFPFFHYFIFFLQRN